MKGVSETVDYSRKRCYNSVWEDIPLGIVKSYVWIKIKGTKAKGARGAGVRAYRSPKRKRDAGPHRCKTHSGFDEKAVYKA